MLFHDSCSDIGIDLLRRLVCWIRVARVSPANVARTIIRQRVAKVVTDGDVWTRPPGLLIQLRHFLNQEN